MTVSGNSLQGYCEAQEAPIKNNTILLYRYGRVIPEDLLRANTAVLKGNAEGCDQYLKS